MILAPRRSSDAAGAIPGEVDVVDPSILGSADGPLVPDGDDPAAPMILCDAIEPAGAPVTEGKVYPRDPENRCFLCAISIV